MELVRGQTLDEFLRDRPSAFSSRAELEFRLALFRKIGEAVAYAHHRGVIHRDLKPSNVMVVRGAPLAGVTPAQPLVPEVKLLDFGIGRITDADLAAVTFATEAGKVMGTLAYMSPEQTRGNPDEIDLRSDVYSLGMILFEVLAGRRAYEIQGKTLHEALHAITDLPPQSLAKVLPAGTRRERDLDIIVQTALAKDPSRRYQSVSGLIEDLELFLARQPIRARPPSTAYQLRLLVARHRFGVAFGATVLALLGLLAATMTIQAQRVGRERDRARQQAERAQFVTDFLTEVFEVSDPSEGAGVTVTARELLDRAATLAAADVGRDPDVQASLLGTMGTVYENLGLYDRAVPLLEKSLEMRRARGRDDVDLAEAQYRLASAYVDLERYGEAEPLLHQALEIDTAKLGPESRQAVASLVMLGNLHFWRGEEDEARKLYEDAVARAERRQIEDSRDLATARNNLGILCARAGRHDDAERLYRSALATREKILGRDHPEVASTLNNLAELRRAQGRGAEAEPLYRRALAISEKVYPADHPRLAIQLNNLAEVFREEGQYAEAESLYRRALEIFERSLGTEHSLVGTVLFNVAEVRLRQGRPEEAVVLLRRSLAISEQAKEPDAVEIGETLARLADGLRDQNQRIEAEATYRRALSILERAGDGGRAPLAATLDGWAEFLRRTGRGAEAETAAFRARAIRERGALMD
jgi:tetratricopeptide (TPR) repeat protein